MNANDPAPSVAIIGASAEPSKYSYRSLQAHRRKGFRVFPVNPKGGEIDGLTVYPTISDVPVSPLDRVSMYVPPSVGIQLIPEIAKKGCGELWLNPGSESDSLVSLAESLGLEVIQACSLIDASS
jgi:uncharacterized protein